MTEGRLALGAELAGEAGDWEVQGGAVSRDYHSITVPEMHFIIKRHIKALEKFERMYGEYLAAKQQRDAGDKPTWSTRQFQAREEELKGLAPQVDAAVDASDADRVELHKTWPNGHKTLLADDVAKLIFGDGRMRFDEDPFTDDVRQEVLVALPRQIEGLKAQLKQKRTVSRRCGEARQRLRESIAWMRSWSGWRENIWVVTIVGGALAALIAAAVVALLSA